ncbi:MAG: glutathione S-transferase [Candidatus Azotimanducaceae bacterium]|jgi:glutathione S-transferase
MPTLKLYRPHWSAYTRTVRLVLSEKALDYKLVEVDFSSGRMSEEHLDRHPFSKVPVLDHLGFVIYETSAICRYIDTAFDDFPLQPVSPHEIGRMSQIIALLDTYLSNEIRMGYVNEAIIKPMIGLESGLDRISVAQLAIAKGFSALADCCETETEFLVGNRLSLADYHAAPLFDFLNKTADGSRLIDAEPILRHWWNAISSRASIQSTSIDLSVFKIQS